MRNQTKDQKRNNTNCGHKALITEELIPISYNDQILSGVCNYYIGLAYEALDLYTDAYLSFKKGYTIIAKMQENHEWIVKFIEKLNTLKELLKVKNKDRLQTHIYILKLE